MNQNIIMFLIVVLGCVMGEIGGIFLIKLSHRFPNPLQIRRLGKLLCILGIIGFILGMIGYYMRMWE